MSEKKFFVLFAIPATTMQEWMTTVDEAMRKKQSEEMMQAWQAWMGEHEKSLLDKGLPLGKTKRVTASGVADTRNDLNWYLIVDAPSHEAAGEMFKDHPFLRIPNSYIEIMDASHRPM
ncbi:MAG TPA: hypothetical protein VKV77_12995 [Methylovirgula sp.]|nr:hypothetical protein [Methylovirgula sp.]